MEPESIMKPETTKIKIGAYEIFNKNGKIYIMHKSGEGSEFSVEEIEKAIRSIWNV